MIQFPKMHIATSVVNRILNAHDEIERKLSSDELADMSLEELGNVKVRERELADMSLEELGEVKVTDPTPLGELIYQQLAQPIPEMPPLEDDPLSDTANAIEPIMHGGTALDGLIDTVSGQ